MAEELPPSLFKILREDNAQFRGEVTARFDTLAREQVTITLFAAYQEAQRGVESRQDARIRILEQAKESADVQYRAVVEEQRKARAQMLTTLGFAVFGTVLTIIGGVVLWSITNGLQQLAGG